MDREGGVLVLSGAVGGAVQLLGDFVISLVFCLEF